MSYEILIQNSPFIIQHFNDSTFNFFLKTCCKTYPKSGIKIHSVRNCILSAVLCRNLKPMSTSVFCILLRFFFKALYKDIRHRAYLSPFNQPMEMEEPSHLAVPGISPARLPLLNMIFYCCKHIY